MQRLALIEQRLAQFLDAEVQVWRGSVIGAPFVMRKIARWLKQPQWLSQSVRTPQPDLSITHAGQWIFALAVRAGGLAGVGIDFEPWRALDVRHQRLMLTAREIAALPVASARDLVRIWTVKEACFKADVNGQQRWVTAYALDNPAQASGSVRISQGHRTYRFRYISMEVPGGMLSVAFKMGEV